MDEAKRHIIWNEEARRYQYFDKNFNEVHKGDFLTDGKRVYEVFQVEGEQELGRDATNPLWVRSGRAAPAQYGLYKFDEQDMQEMWLCEKPDDWQGA